MNHQGFDYTNTLLACAKGDQQALMSLYEQEAPRCLAIAMRLLKNQQLAEDIVHDSFVNIWQKAHQFNPQIGNPRAWIHTIVRNQALNALRYSNRQTDVQQEGQDYFEQLIGADSSDVEGHPDLINCLEQLEPERKQCILFAYLEGYSHSEIAKKIAKPLGTVKSWITRSLQSLKECLQ